MIAASHACSCEPMAKHKAPQVIFITKTTYTANTLIVPLAWKFYTEQIIILTWLTLFMFSALHAFLSENPWANPMTRCLVRLLCLGPYLLTFMNLPTKF